MDQDSGCLFFFSAETWFSLLFTVLVEIVPVSIRSISIGTFLFLMNNVGGNLPLLVDPLSKLPGVGLQTALYISWPGLTAISKSDILKEINALVILNNISCFWALEGAQDVFLSAFLSVTKYISICSSKAKNHS